jgi:chaperonin cofactor prefoldin
MSALALILLVLVALLIPIMGILSDSPIGRALGRRLEGPQETPPVLSDLAKKVELLEAEVDDLARSVQTLQDENAFLQQLLADPAQRPTLPPHQSP